jgi:hypothetical protein
MPVFRSTVPTDFFDATPENAVIFALLILVGLATGYIAQVIIERFRDARQAALKEGQDTSVDKNVTLIPNYRLPWPPPSQFGAVLALGATVLLAVTQVSFPDLSFWGSLAIVGSIPFLFILGTIDAVSYRLPFPVTFGLLGWQMACLIAVGLTYGYWGGVTNGLVGAATYAGFLFIIFVASAGNLGFGDVVLGVPLGVFLGATAPNAIMATSNALYGLLLGSTLMAVAFLVLHIVGRLRATEGAQKETGRRYVPFGPNLIAGALVLLIAVL